MPGCLGGVAAGDQGPSALVLFEVLKMGGEFVTAAARTLAAGHVPGAQGPILRALRSSAFDDVDVVVALLLALRDLGGVLPSDERLRLMKGPWQVSSAAREFFLE